MYINLCIQTGISQAEGLAQKLHAVMVFAAVSESRLSVCGFGGLCPVGFGSVCGLQYRDVGARTTTSDLLCS